MRSLILILVISALCFACEKKLEKPALTIAKYSKQEYQINEVVNKLMNEPDVKVMRLMADGVEETRAIGCDAIGEECNAYYEFINKVVFLTKDGELSDKDREILLGMQKRVQTELKKSDKLIQEQWKVYINSGNKAE